MTVPILIPWDLYQGKAAVWCECIAAGARRAVLLPRLDPIFAPREEDPQREIEYSQLDWRLVSPTEADWTRYREMIEKLARRANLELRVQRVESMARWVGQRQVSVPQYHFWLYRDALVSDVIDKLYDETDVQERRAYWRWLLAWTAPAMARNSSVNPSV
jgi:hypothetical protein